LICPICNALIPLEVSCPNCGAPAEDEGRSSDWSGPYSPYEPELVALESAASEAGSCQHSARCPECNRIFQVNIPGWHL